MNRTSPQEKHLHTGHRDRLRAKYLSGAQLEEHELLELLLFECIPRSNTNEIAHRLLNRFGSIRGVMLASEADLMSVRGVGRRTAFFLRFLPAIISRYLQNSVNVGGLLTSPADLRIYMQSLFIGAPDERIYTIMFGNKGNMKGVYLMDEGLPASSGVVLNKLIRVVSRNQATSIILVHNHPDGIAAPSYEDLEATRLLQRALEPIRVRLIDHFIIADNLCYSILTEKTEQINP